MDTPFAIQAGPDDSHPEYATAFADLERRAARGEFTLAQWRGEVHALRQRYTRGQPVSLWRRRGAVAA